MNSHALIFKQSVVRLLIVAGAGIATGYTFFQSAVFNPNARASQFLTSSITSALWYSALKASRLREGLAALFVWYILLSVVLVRPDSWLLLLRLVYVLGLAAAVAVYIYAVKNDLVRGVTQRVAAMGVITALVNGLIIVVLALFSGPLLFHYPVSIVAAAFENVQLGTLLGIGLGAGMELAEYLVGRIGRRA